jgi:membrane protein YqaA with SNARE-associated domain
MQDIYQFFTDLLLQGYLGLFIACFTINMIPFGPSNMVLAGVAIVLIPSMYWVYVGIVVAIAATSAKLIHYYLVRGTRFVLSEERLEILDREKGRVEKWGAIALFVAAASPIPDDPLIVYTGFTRYSVIKLTLSYFIGKVIVTLAGALIGYAVGNLFESVPVILGSIVLTLIITGFLFRPKKSDPESTLLQDVLKERKAEKDSENDA